MNIKRAIGISVAVYVLTFICTIIISLLVGFDFAETTDPADVPVLFLVLGGLAAIVVSGLGAAWYFKKPKMKPGLGHGLQFGVTLILIAFILDFLSIVPLLASDPSALTFLTNYYATPSFITTVALIIATVGGVGYYLGTKETTPDYSQQ